MEYSFAAATWMQRPAALIVSYSFSVTSRTKILEVNLLVILETTVQSKEWCTIKKQKKTQLNKPICEKEHQYQRERRHLNPYSSLHICIGNFVLSTNSISYQPDYNQGSSCCLILFSKQMRSTLWEQRPDKRKEQCLGSIFIENTSILIWARIEV